MTSIDDRTFYQCTSLTSVEIPSSVTSIGNSAFYECTGLTSITIPNSVTSIGSWTFYYCTNLTSIEIPSSVTSIGIAAFYYCTSLSTITIPNSVTSIGDWAFADCGGLTDVYCFAIDVPATGNHVFSYASTSSATLHVPAASIEAYKKTNPWNEFGTIVPLTDEELTGIDRLTMDNGQSTTSEGVYDLNGHRRVQKQKGVNIVRQSNGSVKRIMVK